MLEPFSDTRIEQLIIGRSNRDNSDMFNSLLIVKIILSVLYV